jgi:Spy/CpxP family protein refolding chaperone
MAPNRAHADETAAAPAPSLPPLTRSDLELLPLGEALRAKFQRDNADLVQRIEVLVGRAERVDKNLSEREKPDAPNEPGTVALREERARLATSVEALVPEIEERLAKTEVPAGALVRVRRAARGPLRADRYGRALVLDVGNLTREQRALFERLVPAVDGAVLALHLEVEGLRQATGPEAEVRQTVANDLDQRRIGIERRFWRTVNALLSTEQRVAIGRWLPSAHQKKDDGISHIYLLPGLTPSQGVQIKALLLELEAEASADTSEMRRAQTAMSDPSSTDEAKREHQRALATAQNRLVDLQVRAYEQAKALLTPEQWLEIVALPPHLTGADRQEPLEKMLEGVPLETAQRQALYALGIKYLGAKRELESGYRDVQRRMGERGPDSPEREMGEMMAAGLGGRMVAVLREAYGEVFSKILTPEQIEAWVLGVTGKGR